MKRRKINSCVSLSLIFLIFLSGCGNDLPDNLPQSDFGEIVENNHYHMKLDKEKYSVETDLITIEIMNNSESNLNLDVTFQIEKYREGAWYQIPFDENIDFPLYGIIVKPNESYTQNISMKQLKYDPSPGKYRVVKPINEEITLAREFEME